MIKKGHLSVVSGSVADAAWLISPPVLWQLKDAGSIQDYADPARFPIQDGFFPRF